MKVSVVITVLNEEKTIGRLLASLARQTQKPDEIVIVDGGSCDRTLEKIQKYRNIEIQRKLKIFVKRGANRAEGRNLAIKKASGEIIAITDAGCILTKNWLEEIVKPFKSPKVEVVAGYYGAQTKTVFEKCVTPYVLVMPDKVKHKNFLPASRSIAIRKKVWQKLAGFPEKFSDNEDYVFAQKLKKAGTKIIFNPKAIVYWLPRSNFRDFFIMIYRFARGDAHAGLRYKKMASVFARYFFGLLLLFLLHATQYAEHARISMFHVSCFMLPGYGLWSILKNYRYVRHWQAIFILPVLQLVSDLAVMGGFVAGVLKREGFL